MDGSSIADAIKTQYIFPGQFNQMLSIKPDWGNFLVLLTTVKWQQQEGDKRKMQSCSGGSAEAIS